MSPVERLLLLYLVTSRVRVLYVAGSGGGGVSFPPDFFESATQTVDVEFGGSDVLQLYNRAQLKHRLNTNGLYIANTKVRPLNTYCTRHTGVHDVIFVMFLFIERRILD